jgi:hypothetical protein
LIPFTFLDIQASILITTNYSQPDHLLIVCTALHRAVLFSGN